MTTGTRFEVVNKCEVKGASVGFFKGLVPYTRLYWAVNNPEGYEVAYYRNAKEAERHAAELNEMFKHQL